MCYSGICAWEDYMGDCRFPYNKVVRDKYPVPVCGLPCEEDAEEQIKYFDEVYADIQDILKQEKMKKTIKNIIKPENGIETVICDNQDFIDGCSYGKPRKGHPEGQVIYHIKEVLENIEKFYPEDNDREELRLIAILHDTFKHKVDRNQQRTGENHHGMIARRFAENYPIKNNVLDIIQRHDDAFKAWQKGGWHNDWYKAERNANLLIQGLLTEGHLDLYVKFFHCDNATGDKEQENYDWFVNLIK